MTNKCIDCFTKCSVIPQRFVLAIMSFFALVNAYTMRQCISIAIVELVVTKVPNITSEEYCPVPDDWIKPSENKEVFEWSSEMQGIVQSAFYYGYLIGHLPGGLLADRYGGKYVLGLGLLCTSICTLLTPCIVNSCGVWGLLTLRFLAGLGEGPTFPALSVLLCAWIPSHERSKAGAFVLGAGQFGTILTNSISGWMLSQLPWEYVFYLFGAIGLLWVILFLLLCFSNPADHPFMKDSEKEYLLLELGRLKKEHKNFAIPWRHILTSAPVWALMVGQIGHDWQHLMMMIDLPKYMNDILHYPILINGLLSSMPYVAMWLVSIGSAFFSDWLIIKGHLGITSTRKLFTTIASSGTAIFLIAASYAGCDRVIVVVFFTIALGIMGTFFSGLKVNTLDLSPNHAGIIMALVNGIGSASGAVAPTLVGFLTIDACISSWRLVFWIAFAISMLTNLVYVIWASGEIQYWDDPDENATRKIIPGKLIA